MKLLFRIYGNFLEQEIFTGLGQSRLLFSLLIIRHILIVHTVFNLDLMNICYFSFFYRRKNTTILTFDILYFPHYDGNDGRERER